MFLIVQAVPIDAVVFAVGVGHVHLTFFIPIFFIEAIVDAAYQKPLMDRLVPVLTAEFDLNETVVGIRVGGPSPFLAVLNQSVGDAGEIVRFVFNHGEMDLGIGVQTDRFKPDHLNLCKPVHGFKNGSFGVLEGKARPVVEFGCFVVVEGRIVGATADTLPLVGVFRRVIFVVGHAVTIHVVVQPVAHAVVVHVRRHARGVQGIRTAIRFVRVGVTVVVVIKIPDIAGPILVRIKRHARGVERVALAVEFIQIVPRIAVIIVVLNVRYTITVRVQAFHDRLIIFSIRPAEAKTPRENQHQ